VAIKNDGLDYTSVSGSLLNADCGKLERYSRQSTYLPCFQQHPLWASAGDSMLGWTDLCQIHQERFYVCVWEKIRTKKREGMMRNTQAT